MYKTILITLDRTQADRVIIEHIKLLAKCLQSRVVLLHVASGVPAQYHRSDAASPEVDESMAYLGKVKGEFAAAGIPAEAELAFGQPVNEIVKWVKQKGCDLIAMGTHGHQFVADLVLGSTANKVQHNVSVPVLLLRAK